MSDLATAAAAALSKERGYAVVSGRTWTGLEPVVAAASAHLVVPGSRARLATCTGLKLGGRVAVALVDGAALGAAPDPGLAVTSSLECARAALANGWSVAQPSRADDVAVLQAKANLLLLPPAAADDAAAQPPPLARVRLWQEGPMATLVASGPAVTVMRRLIERLAARGVEVSALELAVLDRPVHTELIGGAALGVAAAGAAATIRQGNWDDTLRFITLDGDDDAALVGAVLAHVPAPSAD